MEHSRHPHLTRPRQACNDLHMNTDADNLIGTAAAAEILGVSTRTIHRMVEDRRLTPALVAPAGAYMFHRDDIEQYVTAA